MEDIKNEENIELAKEFATKKFAEAGTGNHFLEVYEILQNEFGVEDPNILIAGLLHDTLEDTSATYEEIESTFGKKVADMVEEVSHPKNYNAEQKKEYYEKIKHISWGGKMIKLGDFKSHLTKFIGAFTGENNLQKFTHNEYTQYILSFLENCPKSEAKETVFKLANELENHIKIRMEELNNSESVQYPEIAAEISVMTDIDQAMREKVIGDENAWDENVDPSNTARMKEIVEKIGWPTISKVGKKASSDAWLLAQHADKDVEFQKHCLELMKQESAGEVDLKNIAYLEDRVRVNSGRPQLYGTQFQQIEGKHVPREIEDPKNVDQRGKEMGLKTLAENIKDMYEKYKMDEPE